MTRIIKILSWSWIGALAAFITGGVLLIALHTKGHLLEPVFLRYLLIWVPAALLVFRLARKKSSVGGGGDPAFPATVEFCPPFDSVGQGCPTLPMRLSWPGCILLIFMVLYLFSSSADYTWFYFISWLPRSTFNLHLVYSQLVQFVLLTAILAPFLSRGSKKTWGWLAALLTAAIGASAWLFIQNTGGAFLYRDDHPSFLFRLWEFCSTFPRPVNYNPCWNGGEISNHPVMSGTAAFGVFFLPFWKFIPIEQCYTPLIAVVFIGLVPLMAVFSMRIIGSGRTAAMCAGLLALAVSQTYFLWLLFYGTVGAVFAEACLMPVSACLYRVVVLDRREVWVGFVLVISGSLMLAWPPNAFLALALLVALLLNSWRISKAKFYFLAICATAMFLLMSPAVFAVIAELLQGSYRAAEVPGSGWSEPFAEVFFRGWDRLLDYIRMGHPLIIFLGLGGAFAAVSAAVRRWFLPLIAVLILIAGWGPEFMPGLQLFRMVIPLFFAALIPASIAAAEILGSCDYRLALPRAAIVAILIVGAANAAMMFGNNLQAPYETLSREGRAVTALLNSGAPEGTRVLFVGPTVHGYFGGHVAFLPCLAGREMMACDYYHFSMAAVEYEYPPNPWRKNPELLNRYLDLYNVSVITTLRENWKGYLRSRPQDYIEGPAFGENKELAFFRVARPANSIFLSGKGRVQAGFNRLEVDLAEPVDQAVIKYNWQTGLAADPPRLGRDKPAEIFPYNAGPGIRFIGIKPNGQQKVVIRYKKWL